MEERIQKILKERYLLEGEKSWDDIVERVSGIHPPIKPLLKEMRFLPSTPTLANYDPAGRTTGGLSSCFPLSIEDDMDSIGQAVKDCLLITKYSGGVGYIFSNLRSSKESVKGCNGSKAGGGLSFERIFNKTLDEIQQGGRRRGAGMAAYDIDYPDILDVIKAKTDVNDPRYSKFNHSIRVPDEFYEKLINTPDAPHIVRTKKGETWELKDDDGHVVTVKELWDKMLHAAWLCAEPGILNVDRIAERNPITGDRTKIGCNPCLHGDSMILTFDGWIKIKNLANTRFYKPLMCYNEETKKIEWERPIRCWKTKENAELVEIVFQNYLTFQNFKCNSLKCTPDHKIFTQDGWKQAVDLTENDLLFNNELSAVKIKSVSKIEERADVYDIEMPNDHNFYANGVLVHNCAEFVHVLNASCNLGSFNLTKYLKEIEKYVLNFDGTRLIEYHFDWEAFGNDIEIATDFMDQVIDNNKFPTKSVEKTTKEVRPIGLGVMGLAHTLILMGIPYSSKKAEEFTEKVLLFMEFTAKIRSSYLANKHKGSYPAFNKECYLEANKKLFELADKNRWVKDLKDEFLKGFENHGVRNSVCVSVAPTGTLSWLANVSGGIEPLFALRYFRKVEIGVDKQGNAIYRNEAVLDPILLQWCESHNKDVSKILEYLEANNGSLQKCSLLTEQEQELFKIANELSVEEHLRILAAATRSVSCSVSKTINLPNKITKEQMGDVFLEAWKMGVIGVTVYRDGCREGILTTSAESPKVKVEERPKELPAEMYHFNLRSTITDEKGKEHSVTRPYYVCVAVMNGMPYEIFSSMSNHTEPGRENDTYVPKHLKTGKIVKVKAGNYDYIEDGTGETVHITGKHTLPESNLINRLVSLSLRNNVDLEEIYEQLTKVNAITDYGQVISRYIKKFLKDGAKTGHKCPSCGTDMIRMEGCLKCGSCGVSKCG